MDDPVVETVGRPSGPDKKTSQKQIDANRSNAKQSTGPKSSEGKTRSAQNALKHGAYATTTMAILDGPLREDPALLSSFVDDYVTAQNPQNALEYHLARQRAIASWAVERVNRLQVLSLAAMSRRLQPYDSASLLGAREIVRLGLVIRELLSGGEPDSVSFEALVQWLSFELTNAEDFHESGLPLSESSPSSEEDWQRVLFRIFDEAWPTREDAIGWVEGVIRSHRKFIDSEELRQQSDVAEKLVRDGLFEKTLTLAERTARQLTRYTELYYLARANDISDVSPD